MSLTLWFRDGNKPPVAHDFSRREVLVGRTRSADLVIPQATIARNHCRFRCQRDSTLSLPADQGEAPEDFSPHTVSVEDLNSPNGMYVNGEMLRRHRALLCGDVVYLHQKNWLTLEEHLTPRQRRGLLSLAASPETPAASLHILARIHDREVGAAVASNPSTPIEDLALLAHAWPSQVEANPALALHRLARPGLFSEPRYRGYDPPW